MIGGLTQPQKRQMVLKSTTMRGFDGGLNVIDDDMNLSAKYATELTNLYADNDGTLRLRGGTTIFKDAAASFTAPPADGIVHIAYFNASLISVGSNGQVLRTQANGTTTRIWDTAIAALLPGAPAAWTNPTDFASSAHFNGELIICNGVDKPIIVSSTFVVTYLQDLATLTNVNTPICSYVRACQRFLVMAGDPLAPNRVHISCRDASGTWFGDPAPNDATRLDVGSIVEGANIIRGLLPFRDKLLVLYAEGTIVGTLGIYDSAGNHTPDFHDGIADYGGVAHHSAIAVGDDGLMFNLSGIPSIKRTVLSTSFKPENASDLIDPLIRTTINNISVDYLTDRVFAVYEPHIGQYMVVIPRNAGGLPTDTCTVFVYNYRPKLRQEAWSRWLGWRFKCGCTSLEGTIFFADFESKIWAYSPTASTDNGNGISFAWTMPWLSFGARDLTKSTKYISFDTRGSGTFTCEMFTDNLPPPAGGNVALSATFDLGDAAVATTGRKTTNKKLFGWPCKFEIATLRIRGTSTGSALPRFVSITMKYQVGSIRF